MKKLLSLALGFVMVATLVIGCAPKATSSESPAPTPGVETPDKPEKEADVKPDKKVTIGVAMATEIQQRWKFDEKFMREKAEELGADIIFQWANYDVTKQANQVENLISQGIDVLVFVGVSNKMVNIVDNVRKQGIPVIAYDMMQVGCEVDMYVDRDNVKVGKLQMEAALDFTDGKGGNFVLVKGDPTSTVAQDIGKGYLEFAAEHPEIKIVADQFHESWSPEKALKTVENALSANNDDIQAFVASADSVALGVLPAIKASKLDGKAFLCGMDVEVAAARLINEGVMQMSVWTKIDDGARRTIEAAYKLANDEKPEADEIRDNEGFDMPTLLVDVFPITKDNLEEFVTDIAPEGWVTRDQIFN